MNNICKDSAAKAFIIIALIGLSPCFVEIRFVIVNDFTERGAFAFYFSLYCCLCPSWGDLPWDPPKYESDWKSQNIGLSTKQGKPSNEDNCSCGKCLTWDLPPFGEVSSYLKEREEINFLNGDTKKLKNLHSIHNVQKKVLPSGHLFLPSFVLGSQWQPKNPPRTLMSLSPIHTYIWLPTPDFRKC